MRRWGVAVGGEGEIHVVRQPGPLPPALPEIEMPERVATIPSGAMTLVPVPERFAEVRCDGLWEISR
jgi:hypothetical protein